MLQCLQSSFGSTWHGLGGDVLWRISKWPHLLTFPSWISERNNFCNSKSLCRCDTSHQVVWRFSFEEFPIRMILATVDLQVTSILSMNWVGSGEKVQSKIFKMATIAAIWDSLSQRFELFFIYKSPRCFLSSFESIGLSVQKKKGKIDFQDGCHFLFPIGTIFAIYISTSHPNPSYQFSNQLALWFRKINETRGPWWPCNAHLSNIALWEPDLELIKANILIKMIILTSETM